MWRLCVRGDEGNGPTGVTDCPLLAGRCDPPRGDFDGDAPEVFAVLAADAVVGAGTGVLCDVDQICAVTLRRHGVRTARSWANGHALGPGAGGPVREGTEVRCKCGTLPVGCWLDERHRCGRGCMFQCVQLKRRCYTLLNRSA